MSDSSSLSSSGELENSKNMNKRTLRSWPQLKTVVEFGRKLMFNLNGDATASINFRQYLNNDTQTIENRIYFLGGTKKRDVTIKYIDLVPNYQYDKIMGNPIFSNNYSGSDKQQQLTKEEQLLRERKRCSFNGITSYNLNDKTGRLIFSERSELFYFDDKIQNNSDDYPMEITTKRKGALDIKTCPSNNDLVSYIISDNLYVQNLRNEVEHQLTLSVDPLKSGVPSYAVQEEFNRYTGYWWQPKSDKNPDGSITYRIVYEEVNDEDVDLTYITPSCENEFGYDTYRYPKPGTPNSKINLKMIEIAFSSETDHEPTIVRKKMQKSFYELFDWYEYLVRGDWTPNGNYFWAQIYNRLQTRVMNLLIPVNYFTSDDDHSSAMQVSYDENDFLDKNLILLDEQNSDTWINSHNIMYFLDNQSNEPNSLSFITANDESGFLHLYLYKISLEPHSLREHMNGVLKSSADFKKQITHGDWCVDYDDNVSVDQKNHLVYFTAHKDPLENHLFVANYSSPESEIKQLTFDGFSHSISINKECTLFVTSCSNLNTPSSTFIYEVTNSHNGVSSLQVRRMAQIINHEEASQSLTSEPLTNEYNPRYQIVGSLLGLNIESILKQAALSQGSSFNPECIDEALLTQILFKPPQIFSFMTNDNCKLYGMIYLPFNYEPGVKYPTVLYVYGGPRVQIITNSYKANKYSRFNILSLLGYCVVVIDSRGSDYRGKSFETHINRKMGTVEINDQVMGLEYASNFFKCIDMRRVAIYGWSYGGYMSLMGIAQRPDVFKLAISGAPVTTWNLYDTAYTERYMGLPEEHKEAYMKGSVLNYAKSFPDEENRLLIIHGMIDENVHFAHTRQLINALIKENKPYQLQIYPNERHGIRSPDASIHCDVNFYSFLERNL